MAIPSRRGSSDSGRRNISIRERWHPLLAQFNSRYPAIDLEIQMGIGTDIRVMRRSEGDPVLALMKRAPSDDRC